MPQTEHVQTIVPPFLSRIFAFTLPKTAAEVPSFIAARKRESAERQAAQREKTRALLAEFAKVSNTYGARTGGPQPRPTAAPPRPPAAPQSAKVVPFQAKAPTSSSAKTIDPVAVYKAVNAAHDECGECGHHVAGPVNGLRALNIKPSAPKARSFSQLVAETYGGAR